MSWNECTEESVDRSISAFDCLFIGSQLNEDERCKLLKEKFTFNHKSSYKFRVSYPQGDTTSNSLKPIFFLEGKVVDESEVLDFLEELKFQNSNILIDATTFDLPDLYHFIEMSNKTLNHISIAYTEPDRYIKQDGNHKSYSSGYYLSDDGNGIDYLANCYIFPTYEKKYLISIGYESHRLAGFLRSDEIKNEDEKSALLGIPPFVVGWEQQSIKNNHKVLNEYDLDIIIAPADDPVQTYLKVFDYKNSLKPNERLILVPLGTKLQALGMIWFAIYMNEKNTIKQQIGIQYDFVRKLPKRTEGVSKVLFWDFDFK